MDIEQIDNELSYLRLKQKIIVRLKQFITNTPPREREFFYKVLELLSQKYSDTYILQLINRNSEDSSVLVNLSSNINNYNNPPLFEDLLYFFT
jgi:hypothetical protein